MLSKLGAQLKPPDVESLLRKINRSESPGDGTPAPDWQATALDYLTDYQRRHPYGHCPLPELYHRVAEPRGLSIGQFHDGLRELVRARQIRLHPFTGAAYQLQEEQYAVVSGQEIKYYAERLTNA